jgi:hypothetical protein
MKKLLLSLILTIGFSSPAFAEEVSTPKVEVSAPVEEAYVPPAEASEGVGGWAVVDPVTNVVHGVIVCTNDVCGPSGSWAGKLPGEYMGCTNCNLRFQTKATEDGNNVTGYSGHSYDSSGNVNNDNSVKWEPSDNSFTINNETNSSDGVTKTKKKLIPSKTASDGQRVETGFVDIETKYESNVINESTVKVDVVQPNFSSPSSITVDYPAWKAFQYDSIDSLKTNIESDVDTELALRNESEPFIETIKALTDKVKRFFGMILGGNQ